MNELVGLVALGTQGMIAVFVSAILFAVGVLGVLLRRNAIVVFMCIAVSYTHLRAHET